MLQALKGEQAREVLMRRAGHAGHEKLRMGNADELHVEMVDARIAAKDDEGEEITLEVSYDGVDFVRGRWSTRKIRVTCFFDWKKYEFMLEPEVPCLIYE